MLLVMRYGSVEVIGSERPFREEMTLDELLAAVESHASSIETEVYGRLAASQRAINDLPAAHQDASVLRAEAAEARTDLSAAYRLAHSAGVRLVEIPVPTSAAEAVHTVTVTALATATITKRPPRALCGATVDPHEPTEHPGVPPCSRCAPPGL